MLVTKTITKKNLETIVEETFSQFGLLHCSTLLDSLKLLGFYYATNAGISINIEDLKTPDVKKEFINKANEEIDFVSQEWQQGFVSDTERFQSIKNSILSIIFISWLFQEHVETCLKYVNWLDYEA